MDCLMHNAATQWVGKTLLWLLFPSHSYSLSLVTQRWQYYLHHRVVLKNKGRASEVPNP